MKPFIATGMVAFATLFTACGSHDKRGVENPEIPHYRAMINMQASPAAIQKAARAIVRVMLPTSGGTGSFISADGLLLTNNHVLGASLCAAEGCYFDINFDFESGQKFRKAMPVFGEPVFVSAALDVAVLQVRDLDKDGKPGDKFEPESFLTIETQSADELLTKQVYVVGHPFAGLKKATRGVVYKTAGDWLYSTNFSVSGNSGSPLLNEDGKIVGLVHRAANEHAAITSRDLRSFSVATSSAAILKSYQPGKPAKIAAGLLFRSISNSNAVSAAKAGDTAPDEATVASHQEIYLNAHIGQVKLSDGSSKSLLAILTDACDIELSNIDSEESEDDFYSRINSCSAALSWFNCTNPDDGKNYKSCPAKDEQAKWLSRFETIAKRVEAIHGDLPLYWLVNAPGSLTASAQAYAQFAGKEVRELMRTRKLAMTFELAEYLAYTCDTTNREEARSRCALDYLTSYAQKPHYDYFVTDIVYGLENLNDNGLLTNAEMDQFYIGLFADGNLNVRDRLFVERRGHQWGIF